MLVEFNYNSLLKKLIYSHCNSKKERRLRLALQREKGIMNKETNSLGYTYASVYFIASKTTDASHFVRFEGKLNKIWSPVYGERTSTALCFT